MTFRERVDAFWKWFVRNEERIEEGAKRRDPDKTRESVDFLLEGVSLLGEGVCFNLGGERELSFSPGGREELFFLLPYVVRRAPKPVRERWRLSPWLTGEGKRDFSLDYAGKSIGSGQTLAEARLDEETETFSLRLYHAQLREMPSPLCDEAAYLLLENVVGEDFLRLYLEDVELADGPEAGMQPLPGLRARMAEALEGAGKEVLSRPDERVSTYECPEPHPERGLRWDIITGMSGCFPLAGDWYQGNTDAYDVFASFGAKAVFLAYPLGEQEPRQALSDRYELEDRLQAQVLGERGSGRECGLVLGGAMGTQWAYVDVLLYDEEAFLSRAGEKLNGLGRPVLLSPLRAGGEFCWLSGYRPSETAEQMMEYLDCPCQCFPPLENEAVLRCAYWAALERGRTEGFTPVLVGVDEMLLESLRSGACGEGDPEAFSFDSVRAYRESLEDADLPEGEELFAALEQELGDSDPDWEPPDEDGLEGGEAVEGFSSVWPYGEERTRETLLAMIPTRRPWEVFIWLPMGGWNDCPDTPEMMAAARRWHELYGAVPAAMSHDELEFYVPQPVEGTAARALAWEQYLLCPDRVEQCGDGTLGQLADSLQRSSFWYFWWD